MQIVKSNGQYRIYGENIEVYDELEPDFYQFMVDDSGPYLVRTSRPTVDCKVYGSDQNKVEKCFKTYEAFTRSLGIMLVGDKGNGKTLFAKQMCSKMIDSGYPVVNVTMFHPSLPTFMTSISQECVFLFDEFEKMFEHDEKRGSLQNMMLSTFDGINMTKKMFIITCNDIQKLSQYIYNRPGRFHYSFTFSEPNYNDIHDYLTDNLNSEKCIETVDNVALFCYINGLNYDCLRSLAFELNNGYDLVESFDDLNIGYTEDKRGYLSITFSDGGVLTGDFEFEAFSNKVVGCELRTPNWNSIAAVRFKISDIKYSPENDLYIDTNKVYIDWYNPASTDNKEKKESIMRFRSLKPTLVSVSVRRNEKVNPLRRRYDDDIVEPDGMLYEDESPSIGFTASPLKKSHAVYNEEKCSEIAIPCNGSGC